MDKEEFHERAHDSPRVREEEGRAAARGGVQGPQVSRVSVNKVPWTGLVVLTGAVAARVAGSHVWML